jgi:hypothetical protein
MCGLIGLIGYGVMLDQLDSPVYRRSTETQVVAALPTSNQRMTHTAVPTAVPSTATPLPSATPLPTSISTETDAPTATREPEIITPTATDSPPTEVAAAAPRCVSVAGDSVAHGDAVFEVPATGYVKARMAPVGAYIAAQFRQRGFASVQVNNRTSPAVGISAGNHPSYFSTPEYAQLLTDRCDYTVIVPWINDLTGGNAAAHVGALAQLVGAVAQSNPTGEIFVLNYFQGAPAPFAMQTFASGFTPDQVNAFNAQIGEACSRGALALPQVNCIDVNAAFIGSGGGHVVGQMSRADFEAALITPLTADEGGMIDLFFSQNPGGLLLGDGVHLSSAGKNTLAGYLVERML